MTTAVQRRRGTSTEHSTFTGLDGEITVNTTTYTLHIHDGATVGGVALAKADGSNIVTSSIDINGGTIDGTVIGGSSAAAITGTTITGTSFVSSGNMTFGDNDKATFGASDDLQIYHDGSNSFISDQGSGNLTLLGGNFRLRDTTNVTDSILANPANYVKLYYAGDEKLSTVSDGINVTGTVTADGLTVDGNGSLLTLDNGSNPATISNTNGNITTDFDTVNAGRNYTIQANSINAFRIANGGDISFYEDTGTTAKFFWDASAEFVGIGTDTQTINGESLRLINGLFINTTGTSSVPSIAIGDSNSGLFAPSAGSIAIATQGGQRLTVDPTGNVGIGTSSPDALFHAKGSTQGGAEAIIETDNGGGSFGPALHLKRTSSTPANNDLLGALRFTGFSSALAEREFARINVLANDVTNGSEDGSLLFSITSGGSLSEAMRIDSSGNLLVGKTANDNTTAGFKVQSSGFFSAVADGTTTCVLNRLTSDGIIAVFRKDGTTVGNIGTLSGSLSISDSDTGLYFNRVQDNILPFNGSTNAVRDNAIDLGRATARFKDLYLSGGVYLGGTIAANLLDDYEEGTFTFTLRDATSGGNTSPTTQTALYTKIGRMVRIELQGAVSNIDTTGMTGGNDLYFDLPFAKASTEGLGPVMLGSFVFPSGYSYFAAEALTGSVGIIRMGGDNVGARSLRVNEITSGATDITRLSLTYFT